MRRRRSTPKGRRAGRGRLGARGQRAARVALGRRVRGRGRGRGSSEGAGGPQPAEVWLPRLPRGAAEARPRVGGGARGPGGRTGDADVTCRAAGRPLLVPASASAGGCDAPSWPACDSEGPMGRRSPSLCGGPVYGKSSSFAPCHPLLKSFQTLPPLPQPLPPPEKRGADGGSGFRLARGLLRCWRGTAESCACPRGARLGSPGVLGPAAPGDARVCHCPACLQSSLKQDRSADLGSGLGDLNRSCLQSGCLISKARCTKRFST